MSDLSDKKKEILEYFKDINYAYNECNRHDSLSRMIDELIELKAAERWIPVEEGLPKERDSIFARFKGTDRWKSNMWEKRSDHVLVTIMLEDGYMAVDIACTHDGKWVFDQYSVALRRRKVLAWRPFPAAYKPEEV